MHKLKYEDECEDSGYSLKHKSFGQIGRVYQPAVSDISCIELEAKRVDSRPFPCSGHGMEKICGVSSAVASW